MVADAHPRSPLTSTWTAVGLVGILLAAGCTGASPKDLGPVEPTTGSLEGQVLSDEALPIANASIRLLTAPQIQNTSGPDGRFGLWQIPAGAHQLLIDKPGFPPVIRRMTIVAGQHEANLTFQLPAQVEPPPKPYMQTLVPFEGMLGCGVGLGSRYTCPTTLDTTINRYRFPYDPGLTGMVWLLEWRDVDVNSAQTLNLSWSAPDHFRSMCEGDGGSPLRKECWFSPDPSVNYWFARGNNGTAVVASEAGSAPGVGTPPGEFYEGSSGAYFQQRFTLYVSLFYWHEPIPEDHSPKEEDT